MNRVGTERLASDAMFHNVAREDDSEALFCSEFSHHEVFGKIVLYAIEAADGCENGFANDDRWADGELDPFEHTGHEQATDKLAVHTLGFERGPDAGTAQGAIWTCRERDFFIGEFVSRAAKEIAIHANVAIAHDQEVVARRLQHAVKAEYLGIGIGRFAGDDECRGNVRKFRV